MTSSFSKRTTLNPNIDLGIRHSHQPTSPRTVKSPLPSLPQIRRFTCSIRTPTFYCRIWGRCPTDRGSNNKTHLPSPPRGRSPSHPQTKSFPWKTVTTVNRPVPFPLGKRRAKPVEAGGGIGHSTRRSITALWVRSHPERSDRSSGAKTKDPPPFRLDITSKCYN